MEIKSNNPGTLPEHILKVLERYWDYKLPDTYRDFLIMNNGGEPGSCYFTFKDSSDGSDVRYFLGIFPDKDNDLLNHLKIYKNRLPDNIFPIAYDSCGNLICISVKGPDRGKVYFWDHEMEAGEGQEPDYSNLTLIADSFSEFLENLKDESEIEELHNK